VVAIGVVLTYLTMLSTSIPVWATITQLRRERFIDTGLTVLYAIMSLLFVTDVAAGVLLFGHYRRRPRITLVWLLLGTGMAMIVVGILEFLLDFAEFNSPELGSRGMVSLGWLLWFIPLVAGIVVLVVTGIVRAVWRTSLQLEAQSAHSVESPKEGGTPSRAPGSRG
jgi:hypothetical protein